MSPSIFSTMSEALQTAEIDELPMRPLVMIVDDERTIADTLSAIFMKHGYATMTEYCGINALETATQIPPDLLITDVVMPGMTGVELAISLRKVAPLCKVLLFSGQAATVDLLAEARQMGHRFSTLAKPVHPTEMLARAAECLTAA
jgi:CheY-like chemotaxis protein